MTTVLLLLLIYIISLTLEYEIRCPVPGEWRLTARRLNCGKDYVCLLRLPENIYYESCDGLDYSNRGSKLVFEPFFNKAPCSYERYQPFPFLTDGSSICVFQKSYCNEEGQYIFQRRSLKSDITCGCNFSKGYTFVTKPRNNCFCIPSEEDCSCHRITSNTNANQYPENGTAFDYTSCSGITTGLLPENNTQTPSLEERFHKTNYLSENNNQGLTSRLHCIQITIVLLVVMVVTLCLYCFIVNHTLPVVTISNRLEVFRYGESFDLQCDITSVFKLGSVKWYIYTDEQYICCENDIKYTLKKDQPYILSINNAEESDIGTYICVIKTLLGHVESTPIDVIYASPVVTTQIKSIPVFKLGDSIHLICKITSESAITSIQWHKNDLPIVCTNNDKYIEKKGSSPELTIKNVQKSDMGKYTCVVSNERKGNGESEPIDVLYEMPREMEKMDSNELKTFIEAIKSGSEARSYVRIQVIGKEGVGKSSLVRRLLGEGLEDVKSTDGIDTIRTFHIRKNDRAWIFGKGITRKQKMINSILQNVEMKTKAKEPFSVQCHSTKEEELSIQTSTVTAKALHKEKPNKIADITDEHEGSIIRINSGETETVKMMEHQTISAESPAKKKPSMIEENEDKTNIVFVSNKMHYEAKSKLKGENKKDIQANKQMSKLSNRTNEMNKMITEEMGKIFSEVKKRKDDISSDDLVECGIWDFAGQKDYYVTHQTFLTPKAIYIIVADLEKNIESRKHDENFDEIGEYIDFWFDSIHCLCEDVPEAENELNPPVILVCTGTDNYKTEDERKKRENEYIYQFTNIIGNHIKSRHKRHICFISNTHLVEEDLQSLKEKIGNIASEMNYFAERLPTQWIQLENAITVLKSLENIYSWEDFYSIAKENSIEQKTELNAFLRYQHNIGNIIFFNDICDYIILQPHWLVKCFRCLVCDDHSEKRTDELLNSTDFRKLINTGELSEKLINMLFQKEPSLDFESYKDHLVKVMNKFDIIIKPQFNNRDNCPISESYYMPCMISESTDMDSIKKTFIVKGSPCILTPWLVFEFNFLPLSYFNRIYFHYIRNYKVCEVSSDRLAIYSGKAVFWLDETEHNRLIICFSQNAISIQIWKMNDVEDSTYTNVIKELRKKIKSLDQNIVYEEKAKCSAGNYSTPLGRMSSTELNVKSKNGHYFCKEHQLLHKTEDMKTTWFKSVITDAFEPQTLPDKKHEEYRKQSDLPDTRPFKQKIEKDIQLPWLVDADEFQRMLSHGEYLSYENCLSLGGPCRAGKSTLASVLIDEEIPLKWNSTDGLVIYFGRNGIDIENKKMVPLKKGERGHEVYAKILRGKPDFCKSSDHETRQHTLALEEVGQAVYSEVDTTVSIVKYTQGDNATDIPSTAKVAKKTSSQSIKPLPGHLKPHVAFTGLSTLTTEQAFQKLQLQSSILEEIRNQKYKIEIAPSDLIDFGGQKSYDMTHQLFIQHKGSFLLMFDGRFGLHNPLPEYTDNVTAADIIKHWIDSVLTYIEDTEDIMPMIMFAATHRDQCKEDTDKMRNCFIKDIKFMFSNYDKKEHLHLETVYFINGIDKHDAEIQRMTDQVVQFAVKQTSWGQRRPMQWVPLELQIFNMRIKNINIITKADLLNVNKLNNDLALEGRQLHDFLLVQHSLGKLMFYNLPGLDNFIIIHPPALVNILRSFVTDEKFFPDEPNLKTILQKMTTTGKISKTELLKLWEQHQFQQYMQDESIKEFVVQLLMHLDILVVPAASKQTNVYLVPCMIKSTRPSHFDSTENQEGNTICLRYTIARHSIPTSLAYKIIGASICAWPLKYEDNKPCLYHKAALMNVSQDIELRIWIKDNHVMVVMTHELALIHISPDVAASVQECLTKNLESALLFHYNSFGKQMKLTKASELYTMEVGIPCGQDVCYTSLQDVIMQDKWICGKEKNHDPRYLRYWTFNKRQKTCGPECKGLNNIEIRTEPSDKHLFRLGSQIGIKLFDEFLINLKMDKKKWESIEYKYAGHSPEGIMSMALVKWKECKLENENMDDPTLNDLSEALAAVHLDTHAICQVFRENTKLQDIADFKLLETPGDDVLEELSKQIGNCALQLGIELGVSSHKLQSSFIKFPKDLPGLLEDILKIWKTESKVPTYHSLMMALTRVDGGGVGYLRKLFG